MQSGVGMSQWLYILDYAEWGSEAQGLYMLIYAGQGSNVTVAVHASLCRAG